MRSFKWMALTLVIGLLVLVLCACGGSPEPAESTERPEISVPEISGALSQDTAAGPMRDAAGIYQGLYTRMVGDRPPEQTEADSAETLESQPAETRREDSPEALETGSSGGDPDEEAFWLELRADGTGVHHRDTLDISVTWTLEGETFTMRETFLGMSIDYTGTLSEGRLSIFNGDPEDIWTFEYVYTKQ